MSVEIDEDLVEYVYRNLDKANSAIVKPVEDQIPDVISATEEDLSRFVRAGGSVDLDNWTQLNEFSKDCLINARYEWRVEEVYMIAKAIREKYGPEQIWGMLDGGEALKDELASDTADAGAIKAAIKIQDESISSSPTDTVQAKAGPVAGNKH